MAGDDKSADVASTPMSVNGSGGSQDGDAAELPGDFLPDLNAWFASFANDSEAIDPLLVTPPLAGAIVDVAPAVSSSVDGTSAEFVAQTQPQPSPPKRKSSTQRQKQELQYLRSKANELETQLQTLKRGREADATSAEATSNTCDVWKDVAKRQRTARSKAEEENATLVDTIQRQLKVARGIEKLLSQRAVWDHLQEAQWRKSDLDGQADDQVFARLEQDVDAMCSMLDTMFCATGLSSTMEDGYETTKLNFASSDGVVLESQYNTLNPFDFWTVESVVWRSLREGRVKLANDRVMVLKESPDVVLSKTVVQDPPMIMKPATVFSVMKRLPRANSSRFVCQFTALTDGSMGVGYPPFQITIRLWAQIQPAILDDGTVGTALHEVSSAKLTILDPQSSDSTEMAAEHGTHREISILTRLLTSLIQQKRTSIHQVIENLVVDAALTNKHV